MFLRNDQDALISLRHGSWEEGEKAWILVLANGVFEYPVRFQ